MYLIFCFHFKTTCLWIFKQKIGAVSGEDGSYNKDKIDQNLHLTVLLLVSYCLSSADKNACACRYEFSLSALDLLSLLSVLHSERPKLYGVMAILSAIGLVYTIHIYAITHRTVHNV